MLGRARKARDSSYECVVAAVRRGVGLGEKLVEPMRWSWAATQRHVEAERAQPGSRHRDDEGGLRLRAGAKRFHALTDQLAARELRWISRTGES